MIGYSPNGSNNHAEFMPKESGSNFTFGTETAALAPYKNKMTVLAGLQIKHPTDNGDQHTIAIASMLTGIKPGYDAQFEDVATSVGGGWAGGISVDQELAKTIGQTTKYKSLQFGVASSVRYGSHPIGRLSYAGAAQPIAPEDSPQAAYTRFFSDTSTLLDNCLGWWCSDVAVGKHHNWANLRAFLFGSAGGRVNTHFSVFNLTVN